MKKKKSSPQRKQPASRNRLEVRFAGQGGQGVVLAGVLLAQAGQSAWKYIANSAAYGPEARGSWTTSDTVFSDSFIPFPRSEHPNFFIAMSQEGYDRNIDAVAPDALIICDASLVKPRKNNCLMLAGTQMCQDQLGSKNPANMFFLGVLCELAQIVPTEDVRKMFTGKHSEQNQKAFDLGVNTIRERSE